MRVICTKVLASLLGFRRCVLCCALPLMLLGCQSLAPVAVEQDGVDAERAQPIERAVAFACTQPEARCHKGRFGLVWRQKLADGSIQNEAVSGSYTWQSGFETNAQGQRLPFAKLNLRTTLGPALGELQRLGTVYQARMADGQTLFADSWQALFAQLFVADLPAEALVAWLHNPQASAPPHLPAPWVWQANAGRYRLLQQTDTLFARVDFIPQP